MEVKFQFTNPENEALLRLLSNTTKSADTIKISLRSQIGIYIQTRIRYSAMPVNQTSGTYLSIPVDKETHKERYFLYFSYEDHVQINRHLNSLFYILFLNYVSVGRMHNQPYNEILNSFIFLLKLNKKPKLYEKLKKFEYRNRKKALYFYNMAHVNSDY